MNVLFFDCLLGHSELQQNYEVSGSDSQHGEPGALPDDEGVPRDDARTLDGLRSQVVQAD